ncbi:hypothetical protein BDZ85DRAFT_261992 [Elsinoe ampelina]|uniref:Domain of unknown function at the cortex 1 domain-containing protein n=1 Tax=Elsinoe ampelina TaxID=302913 RepID=A0A6A6GD62_9PEZI|nr:hypothetical protein BDZ85DRAFT_261992 [Elsinoe ampelina]
MADQYILKVTAGPTYDPSVQVPISPNTETPHHISTSRLDADVTVRVQNYRGLPHSSPKTSPYFSHPNHKHDLYSLQFSFTPKEDLNAHDIVLGNDFDHPIRDKLPPGFDQAFKIVKWFIDPGLEGDVYADEPGLFGPLLSSINTFRIGAKEGEAQDTTADEEDDDKDEDTPAIVKEGAASSATTLREESGIPSDPAARKKYFLTESHLKDFTFQKGRKYEFDFFNPYLDFNEFAVKLPGFSVIPGITIPVISYWDGQPLRYVLKDRKTNEPLFVVIFTLIPKSEADAAQGELEKEVKEKGAGPKDGGEDDELD